MKSDRRTITRADGRENIGCYTYLLKHILSPRAKAYYCFPLKLHVLYMISLKSYKIVVIQNTELY